MINDVFVKRETKRRKSNIDISDDSWVVILIFGLDLSWPLIIFWTVLIFLFWSWEKISLIFRISLVILVELVCLADIYTYDLRPCLTGCYFLKYFDISLTFLADFAGIEGGMVEI